MTPAPAPRVLLVDDELQLRLSLRYLLEVEDVTVVGEAADGPEAVLLAGASVPDVVLMDLRLPTMDGLEATRQIRRLVPATQVVIFTAQDDATLDQRAEEAGAYACLRKGCSGEHLVGVVLAPTRPATRRGRPRPTVRGADPSAAAQRRSGARSIASLAAETCSPGLGPPARA